MLKLEGKPKESGKMITKFEEVFNVNVKYFNGKAEFVQTVKLRTAAKTNLSGKIEYMGRLA